MVGFPRISELLVYNSFEIEDITLMLTSVIFKCSLFLIGGFDILSYVTVTKFCHVFDHTSRLSSLLIQSTK